MKKQISLLLTLAIFASLVSCGGTPSGTSGTETSSGTDGQGADTTAAETEYAPEVVNLDGYEMTVMNYDLSWLTWANTRILVDEETGDVLEDAIYKRNKKIEEMYNFTIKVDEVGNVADVISKLVQSGDSTYDIYAQQEGASGSFLPYISDWHNIPGLNLDKPWWNPAATAVYEFDGKQTALAGNMTLSAASRAVCMVFNKKIWSQIGDQDTDLYGLVRDGKWTVDRFIEIAKSTNKDVNGNTEWDEEDIYGLMFGRGFKGYIASFLCGSGMNFTEKNANGEDEFTLYKNEKGIALLTKLIDAWTGGNGYEFKKKDDLHGATPENFFETGHALFSQRVPNDIYKLRSMEDDIGILPMPKYDEAQENYKSAAWGGAVWTLSRTFDMADAEKLGTALEAMSFYGYSDVIPVYKEVALKTKTARDNESADMLDIVFSTIYFDFGTNIMFDSVLAGGIINSLYHAKSSDSIVSKLEKGKKEIDKYIDDIFEMAAEMQ